MNTFKKIFGLTLYGIAILSAWPVQAQFFDGGVKGGANLATLSNTENTDYLKGFHVGAFLNISPPLSPVGIQPEILYSRIGTVYRVDVDEEDLLNGPFSTVEQHEEPLKIDYLQIPVLMKLYLPMPGPMDPHLYAGPYLGFLMDSSYESERDDATDITERLNDREFGAVVGIGTEVHLLLLSIYLDARFTTGLEPVFQEDYDNGEKNRMITISAGFAF
ncbi:MAG: porin family protein [Balneolales bacterium]